MLVQVTPLSVLCCHCAVGHGVPVKFAVNVSTAGVKTRTLVGCAVMLGATGGGLTVRTAASLNTVPTAFLTTTRYEAAFSESTVVARVYVAAVAPAMSTPPRCH